MTGLGETATQTLQWVQRDLLIAGWTVIDGADLGLDHDTVRADAEPCLLADPRGAGKKHTRDVVRYEWPPESALLLTECASIAHQGVDDYSRFHLLGTDAGMAVAQLVLEMVHPDLRRYAGRMSADFFRYGKGAGTEAHQDVFGDVVAIWVLGRNGAGAESFLETLNGQTVFRGVLAPGELLIFRDEMFRHGVTELKSGQRDALIFITLKD